MNAMVVKGLVRRKNISEILIEKGILDAQKISHAVAIASKNSSYLSDVLVDEGLISKEALLGCLNSEWRVRAVDLALVELDEEITKLIPEPAARRYKSVAFAKEGKILSIAMVDPLDIFAVEDIALRTGLEMAPHLALPQDIAKAFEKIYGRTEAVNRMVAEMVNKDSAPEASGVATMVESARSDIAELDAEAPEIEKIVNAIILTAVSTRASDIHIEPAEDPAGKNSKIIVRYRIDGMLVPGPFTVPWSYRNAIAAKIKIMTNSMNIT